MPCIRPLFHENKFLTNFKDKAKVFNTFFPNQCTLMHQSNVLPNNLATLTNESLDSVTCSTDDISKKLTDLKLNQTYGMGILSTKMIKLPGNSI